jgi:hypothetical protein
MNQNNNENKNLIANINEILPDESAIITKNLKDLNNDELKLLENIDLEVKKGKIQISSNNFEKLQVVNKKTKCISTTLSTISNLSEKPLEKKVFIVEAFESPKKCSICWNEESNPLLMKECKCCVEYVHINCFIGRISTIASVDMIDLLDDETYEKNLKLIEKAYGCPSCNTPNFLDFPVPKPTKNCFICGMNITTLSKRFNCSENHFVHLDCLDKKYKEKNYSKMMTCPYWGCRDKIVPCFSCSYPITNTNEMYTCGNHNFHKMCTPEFRKTNPNFSGECGFGDCKRTIFFPLRFCWNCSKPVDFDPVKRSDFFFCKGMQGCGDWYCIDCVQDHWKFPQSFGTCPRCNRDYDICWRCKEPLSDKPVLTCNDNHKIHSTCAHHAYEHGYCDFFYSRNSSFCSLKLE